MRTMKFISAAFALLLGVTSCQQKQENPEAVIEQKVDALLSQMTLEEKLGQMNQISSYGNIDDMIALIKKGEIGSILNEVDPARINALQRAAVQESRLGIPLLIARDVIHGYKTIFPIPLGQAASFDPQVAEDGARVAAIEASSVGIRWTFAPMIDIARDPRWGRIAEGCGENTGSYEGTEVAQLYVQDKVGSVTRPVKELKRFARITLKPGEKKNVSFELPISELAFWNIDMQHTVEAGDFNLWVAPDSQSGTPITFKVTD